MMKLDRSAVASQRLSLRDSIKFVAERPVRRCRSVRATIAPLLVIMTAVSAPAYGQDGNKGDFTETARQFCEADAYKNRMPEAVDKWMVASIGDEWIYGEKARPKTEYEKSQDRIKAQIKALQDQTSRAYGMATEPDEPQSDMVVRTPRKRFVQVVESRLKSFVPWEEVICTATIKFTFTPNAGEPLTNEFRDLDYRIWGNEDGSKTWIETYNWPAFASEAFMSTTFVDGVSMKAEMKQRLEEQKNIKDFITAAEAQEDEETRRRRPACEAAGGTWGYKTRNGIRVSGLGCYFQTVGD